MWCSTGLHLVSLPVSILVYMRPVGGLVRRHGLQYVHFVDDTHLSFAILSDPASAIACFTQRLSEIGAWMRSRWLRSMPIRLR